MKTLRRFENELGRCELMEYMYRYYVRVTVPKVLNSFIEYNYKQEAVAAYQFNIHWLENNNK